RYTPIGQIYDEKSVVNGVVGLLATGGSTNHTMHVVAMAAAAGIVLTWDDLAELSHVVPLLTRVYPNGYDDVNAFHQAGGMGVLIKELLAAGLVHKDVTTVMGTGLDGYLTAPVLEKGNLTWTRTPEASSNTKVLRGAADPFQPTGGLNVLKGNIGTAVIKSSAIPADRHVVEAPARVFHSQDEMKAAFKAGELNSNVIAVVRFQGPKANGMPELHSLTPSLSVLQNRGLIVGLVTDGRMSGASGKVPAAIHVTPEAADGGDIARIQDGDVIRIDADAGTLQVLVEAKEFAARPLATANLAANETGVGRELFAAFRRIAGSADRGASIFEVM
ncbi:MAG: phosphogluconate dehydratase, partial [Phyllobacteriaceae bacterium]|nr:phosphogluconate dehydratase [Phyllobacteriaceae bacterium]